MKPLNLLAGVLSPLLLGGCTMTPVYHRPEAPIPDQLPPDRTAEPAQSGAVTNVAELGWQQFFTDPNLQQVIGMSLKENRDLRRAILNTKQARQLYRVQRAELFPAVNAAAAGSKQRASSDLVMPGADRTTEMYTVELGIASWEFDLFGRIRSLKDQALQEYLATEQAQLGVRLALITETATAYMTLAAERDNLRLTRSTLTAQKETFRLVHRQYDSALATDIDLRRAQTQVDAARTAEAEYIRNEAQARNALNLLAGQPVPETLLPRGLADICPSLNITPDLSSDALLLRPDIIAAEYWLKSAYANIGAARAAFFPRIGLTTAVGTASDELSGLFGSNTDTWNFTPTVSMPIFDARVWAAHRVSKAARDIAIAQYEQTIQAAFREVADVLAVRTTIDQQLDAQQSVSESALAIHQLADKRFSRGIDSYLSVLDAQRSFFSAQQAVNSLRLIRRANNVRMYAVLGGGMHP